MFINDPFIIINIGSGISILKIVNILNNNYERISGTSFGGATIFSIAKHMLNVTEFNEFIKLAQKGSNQNVDLMIKDIYQKSADINLDEDLIASSLAKMDKHSKLEDIAYSLFKMFTYNICQIALLCAKLHNIKNIIFLGRYFDNNLFIMDLIKESISYWSHNLINPYFIHNCGYVSVYGIINN